MKHLYLVLLVLTASHAQTLQWQKTIGSNGADYGYSASQTTDGGYIAMGYLGASSVPLTGFHGEVDFGVTRLDASGTLLWTKCLGGTGRDYGRTVRQTTDGGFVVIGSSWSSDGDVTGHHGNYDFWVVKLDASGNITWQKMLGGVGTDYGFDIRQTNDGGYVCTGSSNSSNGDVSGGHGNDDYWVAKLDGNGTLVWQKCYGGTSTDEALAIIQSSDGGYVVVGSTISSNGDVTGYHAMRDFWIVKTDGVGTIQWQKAIGGSLDDRAYAVVETASGHFVVAGSSKSINGDVPANYGLFDILIVKMDALGNLVWQKHFGGNNNDVANAIVEMPSGGYAIAGYSSSQNGDITPPFRGQEDYFVMGVDSNGVRQWSKNFGGTLEDEAKSIGNTVDGGFILCGHSRSNNVDVTGGNGSFDFWIVKTGAPPVLSVDEKNAHQTFSIFPNPNTDGQLHITTDADLNGPATVKIVNLLGQQVDQQQIALPNSTVNVSLAAGVYFLTLSASGKEHAPCKLIVR